MLCLKRRTLDHLRDCNTITKSKLFKCLGLEKAARLHIENVWTFLKEEKNFRSGKG